MNINFLSLKLRYNIKKPIPTTVLPLRRHLLKLSMDVSIPLCLLVFMALPVDSVDKFLLGRNVVIKDVRANLKIVQERMKKYYDEKHT